MPLLRRSLLAAGATLGTQLLRPGLALGADRTLTIALPNNPSTMDPIQTSNHDGMAISNAVFENLLEVDLDGNVVPCLARAMPVLSDDQLTMTFDLRDDVQFQNGAAFTAEDVKYSYDYMLDPKNRSIRRYIFDRITRIDVESPTKVAFHLREPFRPFFQYQTKFMGIFPKGSREAHGDRYFANTPIGVGTGPGIFVDWTPNDQLEIRRNPNYWRRGVPGWDRVVAKIVPEESVRAAYLATGQAQIISAPPPHQMAELARTPGVKVGRKTALGGLWFMQTNTAKKPFDDVNFRKAVSCAIDRKKLSEEVFYGLISPSAVPAAREAAWFSAEAEATLAYDPARARAYLAKSKYPTGATFDLQVPNPPYLIDTRDAAVVMQSMLAAVGIKMNIRSQEMPQVLSSMTAGSHVATLLPLMAPSDPTFHVTICYLPDQQQSKSSNYSNPALTAAVTESYRHTDMKDLLPIYHKIQAILAEDCPHVWLGYVVVANAWREEVRDYSVNTGLTIWTRDVKLG
jgi:peptide/nickel transport system substrate-binding protein